MFIYSNCLCCIVHFLELSRKVTINTGLKSKVWLISGSLIMGFGIWAMHFVGMMAVHMEMPMQYEFMPLMASIGATVSDHLYHYILSAGIFLHITDCLPDQ